MEKYIGEIITKLYRSENISDKNIILSFFYEIITITIGALSYHNENQTEFYLKSITRMLTNKISEYDKKEKPDIEEMLKEYLLELKNNPFTIKYNLEELFEHYISTFDYLIKSMPYASKLDGMHLPFEVGAKVLLPIRTYLDGLSMNLIGMYGTTKEIEILGSALIYSVTGNIEELLKYNSNSKEVYDELKKISKDCILKYMSAKVFDIGNFEDENLNMFIEMLSEKEKGAFLLYSLYKIVGFNTNSMKTDSLEDDLKYFNMTKEEYMSNIPMALAKYYDYRMFNHLSEKFGRGIIS